MYASERKAFRVEATDNKDTQLFPTYGNPILPHGTDFATIAILRAVLYAIKSVKAIRRQRNVRFVLFYENLL